MSETDKSWIEYLNNRIKVLNEEIEDCKLTKDLQEYKGKHSTILCMIENRLKLIEGFEKERDYLLGEIEKIKKANKDGHPS